MFFSHWWAVLLLNWVKHSSAKLFWFRAAWVTAGEQVACKLLQHVERDYEHWLEAGLLCIFRVRQLLVRRSSTTLSCGTTMRSSIWLSGSSSSRMRTGHSSGRGCWRSYGDAKIFTTGGSNAENCGKRQGRGLICTAQWQEPVILSWSWSEVLRHGWYVL